jgi:hypothetical protein
MSGHSDFGDKRVIGGTGPNFPRWPSVERFSKWQLFGSI